MTPFSSVVPGTTSTMKPFGPLGTAPQGRCSNLRILDADAYDTIELLALVFRGIGAGWFSTRGMDNGEIDFVRGRPLCAYGYGMFVTDSVGLSIYSDPIREALCRVNVMPPDNDAAVRAINLRLGNKDLDARVPFELWRQELCIVRGPHPDPDPNATWPAPNARASRRCFDGATTSAEASI